MAISHRNASQQAERAFAKTQSQFLARNRAADERDLALSARDEKTSRLKEARLARDAADRDKATPAPISRHKPRS